MTNTNLDRLKTLLAEVDDLRKASTILFWDQRVMMPPGGAQARAEALATVGRLTHEKFISQEIGDLLGELDEGDYDYESLEASLIRVTRRDYEKAVRVPPELTGEMRHSAAIALSAWGPAKQNSDLLLDDYEPLMKTAEVRAIFDTLKEELRPLIREVADAGEVDSSFLHGDFDVQKQREFAFRVVRQFGFTDDEWRLDETPHPF